MESPKRNLLIASGILVALILLGVLYFVGGKFGYFTAVKTREQATTTPTVSEVQRRIFGAGSELLQNDPEYTRAVQLLNDGNSKEGIATLESLRSQYATGTPQRNAIESSIGLFTISGGDSIKAVDIFKKIVLDQASYNQETRALAIEGMGRAYWINLDIKVLKEVFSGDPYFTDFLTKANGDYVIALQLLLLDGYHLAGTPITAARLAERASSDVLAKRYKNEEGHTLLVSQTEAYAASGAEKIAAFNDLAGYESYRAEFHSVYGSAIENLLLAHEATRYTQADVENAYKQAYALAGPRSKPYIIYRYGSFLSTVNATNTSAIEDLSGRLTAMSPADTTNFNVFIRNVLTAKNPPGVYKLLTTYMSVSPKFNAYVSHVLAK